MKIAHFLRFPKLFVSYLSLLNPFFSLGLRWLLVTRHAVGGRSADDLRDVGVSGLCIRRRLLMRAAFGTSRRDGGAACRAFVLHDRGRLRHTIGRLVDVHLPVHTLWCLPRGDGLALAAGSSSTWRMRWRAGRRADPPRWRCCRAG